MRPQDETMIQERQMIPSIDESKARIRDFMSFAVDRGIM